MNKKIITLCFAIVSFIANSQTLNFSNNALKTQLLSASLTNDIAKDNSGNPIVIDLNNNSEIENSEMLNVYSLKINAYYNDDISQFVNLKKLELNLTKRSDSNTTPLNVDPYTSFFVNLDTIEELKLYEPNQFWYSTAQPTGTSNDIYIYYGLNFQILECNNLKKIRLFPNNSYNGGSEQIQIVNNPNLEDLFATSNKYYPDDVYDNSPTPPTTITNCPNLVTYHSEGWDFQNVNFQIFPNIKTILIESRGLYINNLNLSNLVHLETCKIIGIGGGSGLDGNLNIENCTNLTLFETYASQTFLDNINITNNPSLEICFVGGNEYNASNITILNNQSLENLGTVSYATFTIQNCPKIFQLYITGTSLYSSSSTFTHQITIVNMPLLTKLNIDNCMGNSFQFLQPLSGTLKYLNLKDVNLVNPLDLSSFQQLEELLLDSTFTHPYMDLNLHGLQNLNKVSFLNCGFANYNLDDCNQLNEIQIFNILDGKFNIKNNKVDNVIINNPYTPNPEYFSICCDESEEVQLLNLYPNYPISSNCNFTNHNISGVCKVDIDNNGCNNLDPNIIPQKIAYTNSAGVTRYSNTYNNGNYDINALANTYTIAPILENPNYYTIANSPATVSIPTGTTSTSITQNFCIIPNGTHHDLEVVIIPTNVAIPGFQSTYRIFYRNKGTAIENATLSFNYNEDLMDYVSANLAPSNQNAGVISWNLGNISSNQEGSILVTFTINTPTQTPPVNGGNILNYTATINGLNIDETPMDNVFTLNQTVVNSYDPNDKICLEGESLSSSLIGDYVHYMIRFENTGDWSAQNVLVRDNIDTSKFDISSFSLLKTSHSCKTRISEEGKVEFIFSDIYLSSDDAYNDGYIVFKIKTLQNLENNSTISNSAKIYFDYNFPIETNVAQSTFNQINTPLWDGSTWLYGFPNSETRAQFIGNYNSNTDSALASSATPTILNAKSIVVSNGADVKFNSNTVLNVEHAINTLNGNLTFEEGASLIQNEDIANPTNSTTGGNKGKINYERSTSIVNQYDYTYWSSPVSNQNLLNISPNTTLDKFHTYSPSAGNWMVENPTTTAMEVGKGYIIRAPNGANGTSSFQSTFTGIPNNGIIRTPIVIGDETIATNLRNMNLIGNPYPSAINAISFLSDPNNVDSIDGTIYFWTHSTPLTSNQYNAADYAVFNLSGSTSTSPSSIIGNAPNGYIGACQSFFVKGINPVAPYPNGASIKNVIFNNSMRAINQDYSNTQFYRSSSNQNNANAISNLERNRIWLNIFDNNGAFKQTLIGYIENATNGIDRGFDSEFLEIGNSISFYSIAENSTKLSIQGRALPFNDADILPLGYSSTVNGSYTISLSNFDGVFNEQNVYLYDLLLNTIHNLKESNYSFTTETGTFNNRFQIKFTNSTLNNNPDVIENSQVIAYKKDKQIVINSQREIINKIEIYDTRGINCFNRTNINEKLFIISNDFRVNQMLFIKVTLANGTIVIKKVVT